MYPLVTIIVPVYQDNLKFYEKVSLRQLYEVLGNYPISYVAPEVLLENPYDIQYISEKKQYEL